MGIKLGNLDISSFKVGGADCSIYLGDTKLYPSEEPTPTPTYEWKQYNAGDTVPSKLFYGVKLGDPSMDTTSIEFGDTYNTGIAFVFEINSEYGWYAQDLSGEQIDISEYYDETENCFIIYFSDLGYGAMPISYPMLDSSFEFDVQLYEEHTSTLQWVTFNDGDTIPSTLNVYGISGDSEGLMDTFSNSTEPFYIEPYRRTFDIYLLNRYYEQTDNVNYIFSDMTWSGLGDYINFNTDKTVSTFPFKLYIYA